MNEIERWKPLPHFDVLHPIRDEREGQNVMAAYEAGKAAGAAQIEELRTKNARLRLDRRELEDMEMTRLRRIGGP